MLSLSLDSSIEQGPSYLLDVSCLQVQNRDFKRYTRGSSALVNIHVLDFLTTLRHTCNSDEIFHNDLTIRCGSAPDTEVQKKIRALTLLVQACLDGF